MSAQLSLPPLRTSRIEKVPMHFTQLLWPEVLDPAGQKDVVWAGFVDQWAEPGSSTNGSDPPRKWLYRVEPAKTKAGNPAMAFLIASFLCPPKWDELPPGAKLTQKTVTFSFTEEEEHGFKLRAAAQDRTPDGKWYPTTNPREWLEAEGDRKGFEILTANVRAAKNLYIRRKNNQIRAGRGNGFSYRVTEFDGRLRITDVAKFAEFVKKGAGKGKFAGLGMPLILAV